MEAKPYYAEFHESVGYPAPNIYLPKTVPAPEGILTLFADYEKAERFQVPLYLINRTNKTVNLPAQDGNIYLKLEIKSEDGTWLRAQPHYYSDCGNSYLDVALPPGNHFTIAGYLRSDGIPSTVRYRTFNDDPIVSNQGPGFFLKQDILTSGIDGLAQREIPSFLQKYLSFYQKTGEFSGRNLPQNEVLSALRLMSSFKESPYARKGINSYLKHQKQKGADTVEFLASAQKILAREWPKESDPDSLLTAALSEIPNHPIPAWLVLFEFMSEEYPLAIQANSQAAKMIADEFTKAIARNNPNEIKAAARLLALPQFAGEYADHTFLRNNLKSKHPELTKACANVLSRRLNFRELVNIGAQLDPAARIIILHSLATTGTYRSGKAKPRNPNSSVELDFWKTCAHESPIQTARTLGNINIGNRPFTFHSSIYNPLREFLQKEAQSPSNTPNSWEIAEVVLFVGRQKNKKDIPLFRSLLKHPACERAILSDDKDPQKQREFRRYTVRWHAKNFLESMGESLPKKLILKETIELQRP